MTFFTLYEEIKLKSICNCTSLPNCERELVGIMCIFCVIAGATVVWRLPETQVETMVIVTEKLSFEIQRVELPV